MTLIEAMRNSMINQEIDCPDCNTKMLPLSYIKFVTGIESWKCCCCGLIIVKNERGELEKQRSNHETQH